MALAIITVNGEQVSVNYATRNLQRLDKHACLTARILLGGGSFIMYL